MLTIADLIDKERELGLEFGPFYQHYFLSKAPEQVKKMLELNKKYSHLQMIRQGFTAQDLNDVNTTDFSAVSNTAVESNLVGSSQALINQFCAIPPNQARSATTWMMKGAGQYGNTGTPTIIFTPRWGSSTTPTTNVSLGVSPTATTITGVSALPFMFEFEFDVRSVGNGATAGNGKGYGWVALGIPVTNSQYFQWLYCGGTSATIDTTGQGAAGCGLSMNVTWGTASASNTITLHRFRVESKN